MAIVRCGNGVATEKQSKLINKLDEELGFTYTGKTVREASSYIQSSMLLIKLEREHDMNAWHESEAYWGDQ